MNSFELSKRLTDSWFRLAGALEMMEGINVQLSKYEDFRIAKEEIGFACADINKLKAEVEAEEKLK